MVKYYCDRCHKESERANTAYTDKHIHLCTKCHDEWQTITIALEQRMHDERIRLARTFMRMDPPTSADNTVIIPDASESDADLTFEFTIEGELLS